MGTARAAGGRSRFEANGSADDPEGGLDYIRQIEYSVRVTRTADLDPSPIFAALSDRTRLRLLNLLREGETCVCDLVEGVRAPQPTVSRHLAVLRRSGLVQVRKDGLWCHYQLAEGAAELLGRLFDCLEKCSVDCVEFPRDQRRVRASRRARGCCD
jgi:ArsR family transcriptional regulator